MLGVGEAHPNADAARTVTAQITTRPRPGALKLPKLRCCPGIPRAVPKGMLGGSEEAPPKRLTAWLLLLINAS
jgi:hypothetical protein